MIVGEAPGRDEDQRGRLFIGKAGELLDKVLDAVGLKRTSVYITNSNKCRPPMNATPTAGQIKACLPYLTEEIAKVKPKVIVLLGRTAIRAVTGESISVREARGKRNWWHEYKGGKARLIATYHTAAVLHSRKEGMNVAVQRLQDILDDFERIPEEDSYKAESVEIIHQIPRYVKGRVVAIDCETSGLNPFAKEGKVLCLAASSERDKAVVTEDLSRLIDRIRLKENVVWVGHNIKFDLHWLCRETFPHFDIQGEKLADTATMMHLIDENLPSYRLEYLAERLTGYGDYHAPTRKGIKHADKLPIDLLKERCAYDAAATLRVYNYCIHEIANQGLTKLHEATCKVLPLLFQMESRGVGLDVKELERQKRDQQALLLKEQNVLKQFGVNPDSPTQLRKLLYEDLGLTTRFRTATGQPSTDVKAINQLVLRTHDEQALSVLKSIQRYRKVAKILGTYIVGFERKAVLEDASFGVLHPRYHTERAATLRLSSSNPNFQNIPRDKTAPTRRLIVPASRERGRCLLSADYSQIELRMAAYLLRDKAMLEAFRKGEDLHAKTAKALFPDWNGDKHQREIAKTVNFAIFYGAGPGQIANLTKTSIPSASSFIRKWFMLYPGVEQGFDAIRRELLSKGYITTIFGLRRRLALLSHDHQDPKYKEFLRQACNTPIQSTAGILTWMAMKVVADQLPTDCYVMGNVHDEIVLDLPTRKIKTVGRTVREAMTDPEYIVNHFGYKLKFDVPLQVDLAVGPSWGELEEV